jgi:hypothetical protein
MGLLAPNGNVADPRSGERSSAVALAVALLALSVLDLVLTDFGIRALGAREINPLMAPLIGTSWAPIVKIAIPLVVVVTTTQVRTQRAVRMLRIVVGLYLALTIVTLAQIAYFAA